MAKKTLNIALIGYKFMGRVHSQAWRSAGRFFDLGAEPNLKVVCGRTEGPLREFAARWEWEETDTEWRRVVTRDDIDVVDIATPTLDHCDIAKAAAQAGKHIFCEKPIALSSSLAREMFNAARQAEVVHYLNHNYRRCPAVALARQYVNEGKIGRIFHWRGAYLQSWILDPLFPLTWHLQREVAGAGPHYDLNSHSVDLARFLVGEIAAVTAMMAQFVPERPLVADNSGPTFAGSCAGEGKGKVTVEDAAFMLAEFENGALGSFETSRFAAGRKNYNYFEIYGSDGSLAFDLERMNELRYWSAEDDRSNQGFKTILVTEDVHPYAGRWWPPGHIIGYEHTFTHAVADFIDAITEGTPIRPDFGDGVREMEVLEAGLTSASTGQRIGVSVRRE